MSSAADGVLDHLEGPLLQILVWVQFLLSHIPKNAESGPISSGLACFVVLAVSGKAGKVYLVVLSTNVEQRVSEELMDAILNVLAQQSPK